MDHLREYESTETMPKRVLPKKRGLVIIERLMDAYGDKPEHWVAWRRYANVQRAMLAMEAFSKNGWRGYNKARYRLKDQSHPTPAAE